MTSHISPLHKIRYGVVDLPLIVGYVKQIASALQYAHIEKKLVHRDIKPANILLGQTKEILLSDFDFSTLTRSYKTSQEDMAGTIVYMAPEQILGEPVRASDQYSLGVVVYEWLSGRVPFDGQTFIEIGMKHAQQPPPPFQKALNISPQVEQVVQKALAKNPQQRFASVQEFAETLEQAYQPRYTPLKPAPPRPQPPIQVHQPKPKVQARPTRPVVKTSPSLSTIKTVLIVLGVILGLVFWVASCAFHWGHPSIVSFTVDQTNVSVGTKVNFTLTIDTPLGSSNSYGVEVSYPNVNDLLCDNYIAGIRTTCVSDWSGDFGCDYNSTSCTFTYSYDHPVTVNYKAYVCDTCLNTGEGQVGDAKTLTVTWS